MAFKKILRWVTIVAIPLSILVSLVGTLFRIQHWEGGGLLLGVGSLAILFSMLSAMLYAILVKPVRPHQTKFDFEKKDA